MKGNPGDVLSKHAHGRTDQVRKKLRDAMKTIELEIEENEGIYPYHGGRLSMSEVCRRAGVHKVTLQGAAHRDTSKPMIEAWIKGLKAKLITGRKSVRKTVTERADDWQARYKDIANQFNQMYAIHVIAKDKAIRSLTERVAALEDENLTLRSQLSAGKVVRIPQAKEAPKHNAKDMRRLVLIRGIPGSGKSTQAAKLKAEQGYEHFEADMFFVRNGTYVFEQDMLPAAHDWCLTQTREALQVGRNVVVSNIFETPGDIRPYVLLGYPWEIIETTGRWQSIHDVPEEKIKAMRSSWVSREQIIHALSRKVSGSGRKPRK